MTKYAIYQDAPLTPAFAEIPVIYFANIPLGEFVSPKALGNVKNAYLFDKREDAEAFVNFAANQKNKCYIEEVQI